MSPNPLIFYTRVFLAMRSTTEILFFLIFVKIKKLGSYPQKNQTDLGTYALRPPPQIEGGPKCISFFGNFALRTPKNWQGVTCVRKFVSRTFPSEWLSPDICVRKLPSRTVASGHSSKFSPSVRTVCVRMQMHETQMSGTDVSGRKWPLALFSSKLTVSTRVKKPIENGSVSTFFGFLHLNFLSKNGRIGVILFYYFEQIQGVQKFSCKGRLFSRKGPRRPKLVKKLESPEKGPKSLYYCSKNAVLQL